jgi:serine phosphatase RsbU (regulator of sigma subunit)
MIAMIAILIYRFARRSQHEERLAGELEAARTVQQILVPEDIPVIPGFTIQTVYKPFGQVGGDFFQILPLEAGGVLVAIGDVSGKGMPAAMTVSLIVGALRMAVETTSDPAGILAALNRRLYGRNYGGFTTCAILRADADGRLTIANAGHLSPYLYGAELLLEGGLPLGLMPDCEYTESTFHLGDHEQVTLVTDGVVEARSKSGELFGFDRTAAIATRAANSIAQTAQHFGQDDDITVLTLTRP